MAVLLVTLALVASACGGSTTEAGEPQNESGSREASADEQGSGGDREIADPRPDLEVSADVLTVQPLSAAKLYISPDDDRLLVAPPIDQVADTCAVLDPAELSAIADKLSEEQSFGTTHEFQPVAVGSGCRYTSETHAIMLIVGPADQVAAQSAGRIVKTDPGDEIVAASWSQDPAITTYTDDGLGIVTFFGAHAPAGDAGVLVYNSGGTGIDYGSTGDLFALVAQAAAGGVASAPFTGEVDPAVTTADPCGLWSMEELEAFFGVTFGEMRRRGVNDSQECDVRDPDGGALELEITITPNFSDDATNSLSQPIDGSDTILVTFTDNVYLETEHTTVRFRLFPSDLHNPKPALVALAKNLEARLG